MANSMRVSRRDPGFQSPRSTEQAELCLALPELYIIPHVSRTIWAQSTELRLLKLSLRSFDATKFRPADPKLNFGGRWKVLSVELCGNSLEHNMSRTRVEV